MVMSVLMKIWMSLLWVNVRFHLVEFCTLFIITITNNDNGFKSCIAKPKLFFCFFSYLNSWPVYYPFVCALFVINLIKTAITVCVLWLLGITVDTHTVLLQR